MAKSKSKKMELKTYKKPKNEHYLVIVNPWTSHCHPSQTFIDNVCGWIERMLHDDWPGTRVKVIYYQRTHKNIIIVIPDTAKDIKPYLGAHHYRRFLREDLAAPFYEEVAYLYEYNYELFNDPTQTNWSGAFPEYTTLPPDFPIRLPYPLPGPAPPPPRYVQYAKPIPREHQFHPDTVAAALAPLDAVENFLATFGPPPQPKMENLETPGVEFIDGHISPQSTPLNVAKDKCKTPENHQANEDSSRKGSSLFTPYVPPLHMNRADYPPTKNLATAGPSRGHGLSTTNTTAVGRSADSLVILDRSRDPRLKHRNQDSIQNSNLESPSSVSAMIKTQDNRVSSPLKLCEPQVKKMDPYEEAEVADALLRSSSSEMKTEIKTEFEYKQDTSDDSYSPSAGLLDALQTLQNPVKSEPEPNSIGTIYTPSDDLLAAFGILQQLNQPSSELITGSVPSGVRIKEEPSDALIENGRALPIQGPTGGINMQYERQRSMTLMSNRERSTTLLSDIRVKMEPQDADHLLGSALKRNLSGSKHSRQGSDDYGPVKKIKTEPGQ